MTIAASKIARLFTLRLWQQEGGAAQVEWRGKVQALPDGEAYNWEASLKDLLEQRDTR